jgi:hypothetical protein
VSDEQLSTPERHALFALMVAAREVDNKELAVVAGVKLDGVPRRRLNEMKLVTSTKTGRSFRHELTDLGWARAQEEFAAPAPAGSQPAARVLAGVLGAVSRFARRTGTPLAEIFTLDVEQAIRTVYAQLADGPAAPVRLSALRARLDGLPLDPELTRMADLPGVHLREEANQQLLTDDDRAAALRLGGLDRHNLQIESP